MGSCYAQKKLWLTLMSVEIYSCYTSMTEAHCTAFTLAGFAIRANAEQTQTALMPRPHQ